MRVVLSLLALLTVAALARAEEPLVPGQFAQGFALELSPGAAVYRVRLDATVYRSVQRADLGDTAVFNGAGEAVPQAFEATPAPATRAPEEHPLPFYPVRDDAGEDTRSGLSVTVDAAGAVISIEAPAGAVAAEGPPSWIVDAGEGFAALRGLRIEWTESGGSFAQPVTVYTSTDLLEWNYLTQATLADLEHGGHRLRQDLIEFGYAPARFLRIDWNGTLEASGIRAVHGRLAPAEAPVPREFLALACVAVTAPDTGCVFDTGGPVPVDRLRVHLPGENNLAELRVWSRPASEARWIERGTALAWQLAAAGSVLQSAEIAVPTTRDRHWRLEALNADAGALGQAPTVDAGWIPDALLFVARGSGPFTLAAGSATGVAPAQPVAGMLETVGADGQGPYLAEALLGEAHALGGEQALRPPVAPVPWQRYLMWALLVGGVVVLLRMALSLLRQPRAE
jgi:hypothetical protein